MIFFFFFSERRAINIYSENWTLYYAQSTRTKFGIVSWSNISKWLKISNNLDDIGYFEKRPMLISQRSNIVSIFFFSRSKLKFSLHPDLDPGEKRILCDIRVSMQDVILCVLWTKRNVKKKIYFTTHALRYIHNKSRDSRYRTKTSLCTND